MALEFDDIKKNRLHYRLLTREFAGKVEVTRNRVARLLIITAGMVASSGQIRSFTNQNALARQSIIDAA